MLQLVGKKYQKIQKKCDRTMTDEACKFSDSARLLAIGRSAELINFVTVGGIREGLIYKMKVKFVRPREDELCSELMESEQPYKLKLWR